ncbi:MAG: InlB B-repeat-containing protein [Myxococcales bacterium]
MRATFPITAFIVFVCSCSASESEPPVPRVGPALHFVTITVTGPGAVRSSGFDCVTGCTQQVAGGTTLHLSAAATPDSIFGGWSGACSGTGACDLLVDRDLATTATFERVTVKVEQILHTLTVRKNGSGTVRSAPTGIDCGATCSARFGAATQVALIAHPDPGWRFAGWSDGCRGDADCTVLLGADLVVTAKFRHEARLALTISGAGQGSVAFAPGGQDCERSCEAIYKTGTTLHVSASPAQGSIFMGWTGSCSGLGACNVRLDQDMSIGAIFWLFPAYTVAAFGDVYTRLGGMDDAGNIVYVRPPGNLVGDIAYYRDASTGEERQLWPGADAWAVSISRGGRIALTTFHWNGNEDAWSSYRLRPSGVWEAVRTLGGVDGAFVGTVDDAGVIIGGSHVSGTGDQRVFHAYLEDGNGIVDLGSSDTNSYAFARRGAYVAGGVWGSPYGPHRAAVWTGDGIHELGSFGGPYSFARGINGQGVIVGSAQLGGPDFGEHAFIWDPRTQALRDVGGGQLTDINDDGVAVGSTQGGYPMPRGEGLLYFNGVLWHLKDLVQEQDTSLEGAMFINSRGQIIGSGFVHNHWGDYLLTPRD